MTGVTGNYSGYRRSLQTRGYEWGVENDSMFGKPLRELGIGSNVNI